MSCGSSPKLTSSTIAGPSTTVLPREREPELLRRDLHAARCDDAHGRAPRRARPPPRAPRARRASLEQRGALERRDAGNDVVRVDVEPLLEDRRVDGAEVGARLEVALAVEPAR